MPVIEIYSAVLDGQNCSGVVFSFRPIQAEDGPPFRISPRPIPMRVLAPEGYRVENVSNPHPYGDTGEEPMLFDPAETQRCRDGGRVYLRAARVVSRLNMGDPTFSYA